MTAIRTGAGTASRGQVITAAGGLMLAVMAIALIGVWKVGGRESAAPVAARVAAVPATTGTDGTVRQPQAVKPALTVFVVASAAEAAFIRSMLSTAETHGATPSTVAVVLDSSITGTDDIMRAFWADGSLVFPDGRPVVQVFDLRGL
jgi:hypothetical protein